MPFKLNENLISNRLLLRLGYFYILSFASSLAHDTKGLSRFVRQSDSILSDESVMVNDKCVTKRSKIKTSTQFICSSKQRNETE